MPPRQHFGITFCGVLFVCALATESNAADPPAASKDSYSLTARLVPETHSIEGTAKIRWTNHSSAPVHDLYWHLYLNAFRDKDTYFSRSPFLRARTGAQITTPGGVELSELVVVSPYHADLLPLLASHSPNDPQDATDLRVALPLSVAPGHSITLEMSWVSTLPSFVERTGFNRDFYLAGQWFPKLARLEDDGQWAHFRFHPFAEFYADFADYEVKLDVPQNYVVGASGRKVMEQLTGDRRLLEFSAPSVHDFAWSAWPHFKRLTTTIGETPVEILYPPGQDYNATLTADTLKVALPNLSARYGPYPHATLTVVHPPRHSAPAGGMEYPSFITTGGAWHGSYFTRAVQTVTIHELAHQWFQGALASNEAKWPFLDEGLASYAESLESEAQFGDASAVSFLGVELSTVALQRAAMLSQPHDAPLASAAEEMASFRELGAVIYARSTLLMRTLANVYGQEAVDGALGQYARTFAGSHPSIDDFLGALAPLGEQALSNARGALMHGHGVDYKVYNLRSVRTSATEVASQVIVHRSGQLRFPVEIVLETSDGTRFVRNWPGRGRSLTVEVKAESRVVHAWVDPQAKILLDENLLNNAVSESPKLAMNLLERGLYTLQLALTWLSP